ADARRCGGVDQPGAGQHAAGRRAEAQADCPIATEERAVAAEPARCDAICRGRPRQASGLIPMRIGPGEGRDPIIRARDVEECMLIGLRPNLLYLESGSRHDPITRKEFFSPCVKPFTHHRTGMGVEISVSNAAAFALMDPFTDPHLTLALYSVGMLLP